VQAGRAKRPGRDLRHGDGGHRSLPAWRGRGERGWQKAVPPPALRILPPVHADKGRVIAKWASSLCAACYLGDDLGDVAAFRALDQLAARGMGTARIAVRSDEAPVKLLHAADVTVEAPEGAAALLRTLL
jgi:trehalose 6-phosphate phosphatase